MLTLKQNRCYIENFENVRENAKISEIMSTKINARNKPKMSEILSEIFYRELSVELFNTKEDILWIL